MNEAPNRALTVPEAARLLRPFVSRTGIYRWIERGEIDTEKAPRSERLMIRESEVVRVLAWYEGIDPEVVRARLQEMNEPTPGKPE